VLVNDEVSPDAVVTGINGDGYVESHPALTAALRSSPLADIAARQLARALEVLPGKIRDARKRPREPARVIGATSLNHAEASAGRRPSRAI
jgi:hypothetical protein